MNTADAPVLVTAFLAGLLGSGHCFGMCGGIAAGLGAMARGGALVPALQFNVARLASYAVLGLISAAIVDVLPGLARAGPWLRIITAVMILLIGLRFLFDFRGLDLFERSGAGIWSRVMPLARKAGARQDYVGRIALGFCWGFLPCGLVYTVLLTAASTGNAATGAVTMLAFGAGTLPAMTGLTAAAPALSTFLEDKTVRRVIGLSLVVLAMWALFLALSAQGSGRHH